jgi:hypothetical protein
MPIWKYAKMKELRASVKNAGLRIAFAFDPERQAILLIGGNKAGAKQKRFYERLIATAEALYEAHLAAIERRKKEEKE